MKSYESEIEALLNDKLNEYEPSVQFGRVWSEYRKNYMKESAIRRLFKAPRIAVVVLAALLIIGFVLKPRVDKIDYPFVDDPRVIGRWQTVDCVKTIDQFVPGQKALLDQLPVNQLVFVKGGKMLMQNEDTNGSLVPSVSTWTKGLMIYIVDKTASQYEIREVNGTAYMFLEWKTGDYVYWHRKPSYYVLVKIDDHDYSDFKVDVKEDKIDYPFEDDPQLPGTWQAVDAVSSMDQFQPMDQQYPGVLYLQRLDIKEKGSISEVTTNGQNPEGDLTWTRGLIISKQEKTASHYEIKKFGRDTYLFYEWKSGDYKTRGMKPKYYVLKRIT
ncbi:MAG TPA: hypothetical protein VN426_12040 [Syntrophomonadaceae bacterium]|nr:hypothetical protein [Syntrophomonadaceae bacterium]